MDHPKNKGPANAAACCRHHDLVDISLLSIHLALVRLGLRLPSSTDLLSSLGVCDWWIHDCSGPQ